MSSPVGRRDDSSKVSYSLLPTKPIESVVKVLMFGASKYEIDNWKYVPNARSRYFDAAIRHLMAWKDGKRLDSESGQSHLAHAACCLLFLLWFETREGKRQARENDSRESSPTLRVRH